MENDIDADDLIKTFSLPDNFFYFDEMIEEEEDDEDLEEKRRAFEERSEPRDEWERYRLWPGDPGVCESVEELLATVARHVCHNCLSADNGASLYGTDNMTVTIVLFRHSALGRAVRSATSARTVPATQPRPLAPLPRPRPRSRSTRATGRASRA